MVQKNLENEDLINIGVRWLLFIKLQILNLMFIKILNKTLLLEATILEHYKV